jgi:outer membrane protein assembly factor BamB
MTKLFPFASAGYTENGVVVDGVRYSWSGAAKTDGDAKKDQPLYGVPTPKDLSIDGTTFVYAGGTIYFLAEDAGQWGAPIPGKSGGAVLARDPKTGQELWSFHFPERPYQIIEANGRLFVSTRGGTIYCFGPEGTRGPGVVAESTEAEPFKHDESLKTATEVVDRMKKAVGLNDGYVVVLDCDSGVVPYALARQANFYVCAVFDDAAKAEAARALYERADLNVSRIIVWHRQPGTKLTFTASAGS